MSPVLIYFLHLPLCSTIHPLAPTDIAHMFFTSRRSIVVDWRCKKLCVAFSLINNIYLARGSWSFSLHLYCWGWPKHVFVANILLLHCDSLGRLAGNCMFHIERVILGCLTSFLALPALTYPPNDAFSLSWRGGSSLHWPVWEACWCDICEGLTIFCLRLVKFEANIIFALESQLDLARGTSVSTGSSPRYKCVCAAVFSYNEFLGRGTSRFTW